ncbi:hypothetical protein KAR48_00295 [bacterium]|nr:hypothetical protein [bacterium]
MMGRSYDFDNFWYKPTVAKEVDGGIKARSRWGAFAKKWWGKRWVQTLEDFDDDPFLLFKLRGLDRDKFLEQLRETGVKDEICRQPQEIEPESLPLELSEFWGEKTWASLPAPAGPVKINAALPKRLGVLSFWRSETDFINEMNVIYRRASGEIENKFFNLAQ